MIDNKNKIAKKIIINNKNNKIINNKIINNKIIK